MVGWGVAKKGLLIGDFEEMGFPSLRKLRKMK